MDKPLHHTALSQQQSESLRHIWSLVGRGSGFDSEGRRKIVLHLIKDGLDDLGIEAPSPLVLGIVERLESA